MLRMPINQYLTSLTKIHPHRRTATNSTFRHLTTQSSATPSPPPTRTSSTTADEESTPPPTSKPPSKLTISSKLTTTPDPTRAVFPWRHSPLSLPRLTPGTEQNESIGPAGPGLPAMSVYQRMFFYAMAARELGVPWYSILGSVCGISHWEKELEMSFAWAFGRGVAGVVADSFDVAVDDIEVQSDDLLNGIEVNFDYTSKKTQQPSSTEEQKDNQNQHSNNEQKPPQHQPRNDNPVNKMLDPKLHNLYKNARLHHKSTQNLRIRLQTLPLSAELESLITIPILTRDLVDKNPSLKHSYRALIYDLFTRKRNENMRMDQLGQAAVDSIEQLARKCGVSIMDDDALDSTVIAQVSVKCWEVFWVVDAESGEVLQGKVCEEGEIVTHLARFEIVLGRDVKGTVQKHGRWQITDWDDLLGGNVFF